MRGTSKLIIRRLKQFEPWSDFQRFKINQRLNELSHTPTYDDIFYAC